MSCPRCEIDHFKDAKSDNTFFQEILLATCHLPGVGSRDVLAASSGRTRRSNLHLWLFRGRLFIDSDINAISQSATRHINRMCFSRDCVLPELLRGGNGRNRALEQASYETMNPKLILCFARGLFYTYCLVLPYGLFVAWAGIRMWNNSQASWWEIVLGALGKSFYTLVTSWYWTLPLAAAMTWCLYLRQSARAAPKDFPGHTKP
jgi:hypothetical protein